MIARLIGPVATPLGCSIGTGLLLATGTFSPWESVLYMGGVFAGWASERLFR